MFASKEASTVPPQKLTADRNAESQRNDRKEHRWCLVLLAPMLH